MTTYQYRCHLHQDDNNVRVFDAEGNDVEPRPEHFALAGSCEHGVGILDHCEDCHPTAERVRS